MRSHWDAKKKYFKKPNNPKPYEYKLLLYNLRKYIRRYNNLLGKYKKCNTKPYI